MSIEIKLNKGRVRYVRTETSGILERPVPRSQKELVADTELYSERVVDPQECLERHMLIRDIWNRLSYGYEEQYCSRSVLILGDSLEDLRRALSELRGCGGAGDIAHALEKAVETVEARGGTDGLTYYLVFDNNDD